MNNEKIELWKEKTKAIFHILEYKRFWNYINNLQEENERLKFYLNDVVFDDNNADVELSARYLRKLGYIDFDEERQVYINKHNNQPIMQEDTKEKSFYIKDDELNDYTKQLENKIGKANNKLQTMFDNGNEETILDDLLELDKILKDK